MIDKHIRLQDKYDALQQNKRNIHVKIFILDKNNRRIGDVHGSVMAGSINLDADSLIRRTGSLTIAITKRNISVGEDKFFWFNNKAEVWIGLDYKDDIVWYKMGVFIFDETSGLLNTLENTITISLLDNMCLFEGTRGGKVNRIYKLEKDMLVHDIMREIVEEKVVYRNKIIEESEWRLEYEIEKNIGDNYGSIIDELRKLYLDYETFIDVDGNFVFRRIRNTRTDPIVYRFDDKDKNLVDISITYSFQNVKNKIKIHGRTDPDSGIAIEYEVENNHPNSPFAIDKIGEVYDSIMDTKIHNLNMAKKRAMGELLKASNLAEKIAITCVPIYNLDVNQVVYINIKRDNFYINGRFQIKKIGIPFNADELMSITLVRLYDGEDGNVALGEDGNNIPMGQSYMVTLDEYITLDKEGKLINLLSHTRDFSRE